MSYILQALKKAEAERRLGQVPDAHTVLAAAETSRARVDGGQRRARVMAGAGMLLLAAGGAAGAWLLLGRGAAVRPVPAAAAPAVPNAAPRPPPVIELAPLPPPATAASTPAAGPAVVPAADPAAVAADPGWIDQLPAAERAALPRLAVAGAIHAGHRADRVLVLDGEARREGDTLAPGLVLESIEPGYALLRWRGRALRLRL